MKQVRLIFIATVLCALLLGAGSLAAQESSIAPVEPLPEATEPAVAPAEAPGGINFNLGIGKPVAIGEMSDTVKILLFLSVLTLLPSILLTMTAFTRIIIVLSFVRRALSLQQLPPNQVLIGISIFLTLFIMAPVLGEVNRVALQPHLRKEINETEALQRAVEPFRDFMLKQTRKKDLALFLETARSPRPRTAADVPTTVILPAFALSEIRTAFQMGFIIFLPMLVIDMVVATILTAMGMFMMPPAMISVPLKILLFVLVDGWHLVIGSLARSFA